VDNSVENLASIFKLEFKKSGNLTKQNSTCAKLLKSSAKKNFRNRKKISFESILENFRKKPSEIDFKAG